MVLPDDLATRGGLAMDLSHVCSSLRFGNLEIWKPHSLQYKHLVLYAAGLTRPPIFCVFTTAVAYSNHILPVVCEHEGCHGGPELMESRPKTPQKGASALASPDSAFLAPRTPGSLVSKHGPCRLHRFTVGGAWRGPEEAWRRTQ